MANLTLPKQFGRKATIADVPTGGAISLPAGTFIEEYGALVFNQTTVGQTVSLPDPSDTSILFGLDVANRGTALVNLHGVALNTNAAVRLNWNGSQWTAPSQPAGVANPRKFAPASGTGSVTVNTAGKPTAQEIKTWAAAQNPKVLNTLVYYTGTPTASDNPTHVFDVDINGDVTLLEPPLPTALSTALNINQSFALTCNSTWTTRTIGNIGDVAKDFAAPDASGHYLAKRDMVIDVSVTCLSSEGGGMTVGLAVQLYRAGYWVNAFGTNNATNSSAGVIPYHQSAQLAIKAGDYIRFQTEADNGGRNDYPGNRDFRIGITECPSLTLMPANTTVLTPRSITGSVTSVGYDGVELPYTIPLAVGQALDTLTVTGGSATGSIQSPIAGLVKIKPQGADVTVSHTTKAVATYSGLQMVGEFLPAANTVYDTLATVTTGIDFTKCTHIEAVGRKTSDDRATSSFIPVIIGGTTPTMEFQFSGGQMSCYIANAADAKVGKLTNIDCHGIAFETTAIRGWANAANGYIVPVDYQLANVRKVSVTVDGAAGQFWDTKTAAWVNQIDAYEGVMCFAAVKLPNNKILAGVTPGTQNCFAESILNGVIGFTPGNADFTVAVTTQAYVTDTNDYYLGRLLNQAGDTGHSWTQQLKVGANITTTDNIIFTLAAGRYEVEVLAANHYAVNVWRFTMLQVDGADAQGFYSGHDGSNWEGAGGLIWAVDATTANKTIRVYRKSNTGNGNIDLYMRIKKVESSTVFIAPPSATVRTPCTLTAGASATFIDGKTTAVIPGGTSQRLFFTTPAGKALISVTSDNANVTLSAVDLGDNSVGVSVVEGTTAATLTPTFANTQNLTRMMAIIPDPTASPAVGSPIPLTYASGDNILTGNTIPLAANKTYILMGSIARINGTSGTSEFTYQFRDTTNSRDLGSPGVLAQNTNLGWGGYAQAFIITTAATNIQLWSKKNSSAGNLSGNGGTNAGTVIVQELPSGTVAPVGMALFTPRSITGTGIAAGTIGRDNTVSTIKITGLTAGSEILQANISASNSATVNVIESGRNGTAVVDVIPNGNDTAITYTQTVWQRKVSAVNAAGGAVVNVNNAATNSIDATIANSVALTVPAGSYLSNATATGAVVTGITGSGNVAYVADNSANVVITATFASSGAAVAYSLANAGVDVTLGNYKIQMAASGNRAMKISTVSGTATLNGETSYYGPTGHGFQPVNNLAVTTAPAYVYGSWSFGNANDTQKFNFKDAGGGIYELLVRVGSAHNNNSFVLTRLN